MKPPVEREYGIGCSRARRIPDGDFAAVIHREDTVSRILAARAVIGSEDARA